MSAATRGLELVPMRAIGTLAHPAKPGRTVHPGEVFTASRRQAVDLAAAGLAMLAGHDSRPAWWPSSVPMAPQITQPGPGAA